ncbi:replication protein H [Haloferax mediterranei ATCC 33500]|uniref:Replication protein H n=1 Tax=Haloferax mediterranei (strain ATCC 33500 / DSM 1411 / JCM 8866 / NBRC 14739 / NCIMB 2177 / R-4) TaxID=523841 RepID=I3R7S8_HALMT|nr:DUF5817 domain-containing protein [Haloferax mediterranei]AFK20288.1 hypothetical protein HFX_2610 [Haloferax mediterranei ATCC 33500]AHZ23657.1 pNRC100 replication protein H-like protein [Haloferax mediterranei ATCC 33500]ELZ99144.1 hypothetical protein C439_14834 [Haloferax mediterranei ATCC 33500]MDX5986957.1 DUF5817 domain-containing protein [Haloferax mediterranei ATCC 33500]QCQ76275.1 replication protein H [Haloferax mediterranei ATCC 33500]
MYAVVGCTDCANMWLLSDPRESKTATCPRCGRRHQTKKLRHFFESEDRDAARQARSALLAKKHGDSEAFAEVAHVSELDRQVDESGVDDREYLEGSGLDADEVFEAGEKATQGRNSATGSADRLTIVREAIQDGDRPTEEEIVAAASDRGVPEERARDLLDKLRRRGEVSESRGRHRLL